MKEESSSRPSPGMGEAPPELQMVRLSASYLTAQAIYVFASLGVAEVLAAGPREAGEIAQKVQAEVDSLTRVLRYLAAVGVVSQEGETRFALTALGRTLLRRKMTAIYDNTLLVGSPGYWNAAGQMLSAVKTGRNAFEQAHGKKFYDYLGEHPKEAAVFNAAMDSSSAAGLNAILAKYDFSRFRNIVDVAGGKGALLTGILKRHSQARGILYDAAGVVADAAVHPAVAGRLTKVAGNYFESVPPGADAYIFRRIFHNLGDEDAIRILRQVRAVMAPEGRLLIIEMAEPSAPEAAGDWAALDLFMMLMPNGRERTAKEFGRLLAEAGFASPEVIRTASVYWILEAAPNKDQ